MNLEDVVERLKPTLEKHIGCDIIDMNPGPGSWSAAIHRFLKPRTHILMEPEHLLYKPFLQPLLDADPSYKFIPQSGLVWKQLNRVLTPDFLPNQIELAPNDPDLEKPNNTLLLIANLGYNPKKRFGGFDSVAQLVSHQLLSASRSHELFHKYGLIRMLLWINDEERHLMFPKTVATRSKTAVEAELCCEDITEVASSTSTVRERGTRFHEIDLDSSSIALEKMKEAGLSTPEGRAGDLELEAKKGRPDPHLLAQRRLQSGIWRFLQEKEAGFSAGLFGKYQPNMKKSNDSDLITPEYARLHALEHAKRNHPSWSERGSRSKDLDRLRADFAAGKFTKYSVPESELPSALHKARKVISDDYERLQWLRNRWKSDQLTLDKHEKRIKEYRAILKMQKKCLQSSATDSLKQKTANRLAKWKAELESLCRSHLAPFSLHLDNFRTYYQDRKLLFWDRRRAEPLKVHADEFFPSLELALLDYQPKALPSCLRKGWPNSWEVVNFILNSLVTNKAQPLRQGLSNLGEGALEWIIAECPSITDPNKGGNPDIDVLTVRCLTAEMYEEIFDAWMRWPLRPSRFVLMRRMGTNDGKERGEATLRLDSSPEDDMWAD